MYNYGPYYGYPFYYRNMNPRFRSNNWNNQSNYHNYYYNNYDDDYSRRSRFNYDNYNMDIIIMIDIIIPKEEEINII